METFENGEVKSVTCHRLESKSEYLSKMVDGLVMLTMRNPRFQSFSSFPSISVFGSKTLVWMKIFCFVFAEMKTDTFENTLGWIGA